jgi:hypothetical protein
MYLTAVLATCVHVMDTYPTSLASRSCKLSVRRESPPGAVTAGRSAGEQAHGMVISFLPVESAPAGTPCEASNAGLIFQRFQTRGSEILILLPD